MFHISASKKIAIVSLSLAACLALEPMTASAASILPCAGVASILETSLSEADYIQIAKEAKGALWGYTNIGIANQESGNLNVRAEASTKGKLVGKMCKNAGSMLSKKSRDDAKSASVSPGNPVITSIPIKASGIALFTAAIRSANFSTVYLRRISASILLEPH